MLPFSTALFRINRNKMVERHKKFIEFMYTFHSEVLHVNKDVSEGDLQKMYSKKLYKLLFVPGEGTRIAPLYINSDNIWLKGAAKFRLENPI